MKKIAIVYHSGTGNTQAVAKEVIKGVVNAGSDAIEIPINGKDIVDGRYVNEDTFIKLAEADAIIFGTPTYMGSASGQFTAFMDATSPAWMNRGWVDKVAGGFTTSMNPSGDKVETMFQLFTLAQQQGMIWVGNALLNDGKMNKLGGYAGLMVSIPYGGKFEDTDDIEFAQKYGERIAQVTNKLSH